MALVDISDNVNKMGSSMESVTLAYQGFAKQQYMLLYNLKLGYCGTKTVKELQERGKFYRVTAAGQREARPHDITITKEAPNYRT
jgi:IMP dehydrogenase